MIGEEVTPETSARHLRKVAEAHDEHEWGWEAEKLILRLFGDLVEPTLIQPTFVCDYPPLAQPLARPHRSEENLIEAWDLIIGGLERATGFSELVDPVIQQARLTEHRWPRLPAISRRCSWTRTSWPRWSSGRRRWAAWGWASTGW